ncbi:hypothetical protein [Cohnella soli]|uniref:P/Homo B domain-containing protein n=1 Tax=Cohnella soli TaxID=425005 RepID=A0ABW0HPM3_9BACL
MRGTITIWTEASNEQIFLSIQSRDAWMSKHVDMRKSPVTFTGLFLSSPVGSWRLTVIDGSG